MASTIAAMRESYGPKPYVLVLPDWAIEKCGGLAGAQAKIDEMYPLMEIVVTPAERFTR